MPAYPSARCPVCRSFNRCLDESFIAFKGQTACYRDLQQMDEKLQMAHMSHLAEMAGLREQLPGRLSDLFIDVLKDAKGRMSPPLEFSVNYQKNEAHWFRFSLAFSDDDAKRLPGDRQGLLHMLKLLGHPAIEAIAGLLDSCDPSKVIQMMFGIDLRASGTSRHKIYLRLRKGEDSWKEAFIRQVIPGFEAKFSALPLGTVRLLGIDLMAGRENPELKLYFTHERLSISEALSLSGGHPFIDYLSRDRTELKELLLIQRLGSRSPMESRIHELDLHLLKNDLYLEDLLRFLSGTKAGFPMRNFVELFKRFWVAPTSVTFPMDGLHKMNLYYLLMGRKNESR